ncbi:MULTISPECIES: hypothetical protein [Clostridium]|uniref:Conserved protein n=2 Tax=Clostridium novyi TaxID=1542 RepID=A0PYJ6_CLONN|nr:MULTISPECIES: hypothetical protein [Clostridium]ABK61839.1 conserved protein [Clostridium novyi NT]KEH85611.1 hypothetical protein Z966_06095 [Clostridium novyi A str. NCTC 538]KEH85738.1 hypothetical protein Z967_07710 [Clostridium novyi A str. 4540]KEH94967.1 hypothetical protein Z963_05940 [Clostridium botulinum C/D str. It1]
MAVISNISNAYNVNSGKSHKKLSFDIGERFLARIINIDGETNEAILKLLDGWQFSAQIKEPIDFTPEGLVKFVVEGYDKGKILLQLIGEENKKGEQSLIDVLEEQGVNVKKEDYNILKKMIKYNMPLTKENISKMKTLIDFQSKINENPNEEEQFIEKYLNNKNISLNSEEGQDIKNILKGFFKEFKKLKVDEIFTLVENKIELTEENIKSFNNINKGSMTIYEEILDGSNILDELENDIVSKEIETKNINNENNTSNSNNNLEENSNNTSNKNNAYNSKAYTNDNSAIDGKEILRRLLGVEGQEQELQSENNSSIQEKMTSQDKSVEVKTTTSSVENKTNEQSKNQEVQLEKKVLDKLNNKPMETAENIKEQIENKTNEMKQIIKQVLGESGEKDSSIVGKVFQSLQGKMNDFKIFNSLSNQYYYLDVPVNINEQQYPCKLIIKDDRKNGKKIDSTNVKFAVCVKTINMGVVDAYIKVMNSNINIDIKCEDKWIKLLEKSKDKIINKLNEVGYIAGVKVDERQSEVNLVECNDFFEDNDFARINFKV